MEKQKILGGGVAGLSMGFLINNFTDKYSALIYEKNTKEKWESIISKKGILIKNTQLSLLKEIVPEIYKILKNNISPIYKIEKIVIDLSKNQTLYRVSFKSSNPLFYLVNLESFLSNIIEEGNLRIKYNTSLPEQEADILANGGSKYGNIMAIGSIKEEILNSIVLYYDQATIPGGYIYKVPLPDEKNVLTLAVIFDPNKYIIDLSKISPFIGKPQILVKTGYTIPHLKERNKWTIGERGGWIDPMRGFGFAFAILSAKTVCVSLSNTESDEQSRVLKKITEIRKELIEKIKQRSKLTKLTNKDIINLLSTAAKRHNNYISISETVVKR